MMLENTDQNKSHSNLKNSDTCISKDKSKINCMERPQRREGYK